MGNANITTILIGAAIGWFGSGFLKLSPAIGAAIGAGGGYLYGGGTIPGLGSGSGTLTVPTVTVKAGS
jgi:hypothetical protein